MQRSSCCATYSAFEPQVLSWQESPGVGHQPAPAAGFDPTPPHPAVPEFVQVRHASRIPKMFPHGHIKLLRSGLQEAAHVPARACAAEVDAFDTASMITASKDVSVIYNTA